LFKVSKAKENACISSINSMRLGYTAFNSGSKYKSEKSWNPARRGGKKVTGHHEGSPSVRP